MKFPIDADLPRSLTDIFKKGNNQAVHASEVLVHATDDEIFEYANRNQYIIVTRDLGFAEMFMKRRGFGLVVVRLPYYFTAYKTRTACQQFLGEMDAEALDGSITVIELGRYRTRKLRQ